MTMSQKKGPFQKETFEGYEMNMLDFRGVKVSIFLEAWFFVSQMLVSFLVLVQAYFHFQKFFFFFSG